MRITITRFAGGAVLAAFLMNLGAVVVLAADLRMNQSAQPVPVLVELFTSEGCSSCPPADALLERLDQLQPVAGAEAIVLSEHVDYWNHDGWKDVYSSSFFTDRQNDYERRFGVSSAYTPQMVVDGSKELNGSDATAVSRAIESARSHFKIPVRISTVALVNPKTFRVHLEVEALPADFKARKADIFVAVALNRAASHVSAGENKGRDIHHVAVAMSINKVGTVEKGMNFDREVLMKVATFDLANLRLIAFVQGSDGGEVVGAALLRAPIKVSPSSESRPVRPLRIVGPVQRGDPREALESGWGESGVCF
ncbi:MAG: DUF1223 domain-containing protein [Terriglobales bacterium]